MSIQLYDTPYNVFNSEMVEYEAGDWAKTEDLQNIGWIQAVDDAMVTTHLGVANVQDSYEVAKNKLQALIQWHIDVALDPCVNGGYQLVKMEEVK